MACLALAFSFHSEKHELTPRVFPGAVCNILSGMLPQKTVKSFSSAFVKARVATAQNMTTVQKKNSPITNQAASLYSRL